MAIWTPTTPARAGERSRSPSTQVGPVTAAIRAMRTGEPARGPIVVLRKALQRRFAPKDPEAAQSFAALCTEESL